MIIGIEANILIMFTSVGMYWRIIFSKAADMPIEPVMN